MANTLPTVIGAAAAAAAVSDAVFTIFAVAVATAVADAATVTQLLMQRLDAAQFRLF